MLCNLSVDDARALFSGMRAEEAMSNITRLANLGIFPQRRTFGRDVQPVPPDNSSAEQLAPLWSEL